jgi:hypothetical protein
MGKKSSPRLRDRASAVGSKRTLVGALGNERDAPIPAIRGTLIEPREPTPKGSR